MVKRIYPAPAEDASATTTSTNGNVSSLGPLNRFHHLKRPFAYKENTEKKRNSGSGNSWTDAATQLAAGACCASGGLSEYDDTVEAADALVQVANLPLWMDYLWLCEGDGKGLRNGRRSRRARLFLQQQPAGSLIDQTAAPALNPELIEVDYARRHEDFFEALLKEQADKTFPPASSSHNASSSSSNTEQHRVLKKSDSRETCSSVSSGVSVTSNLTADTTNVTSSIMNASIPSMSSVKTLRNKHSPLKLHKPRATRAKEKSQNSSHHRHTRVAPIEAYNQMYNPALTTHEIICLDTIMTKSDLLAPSEYVHPQCILQKDKGRGERLKTCISAKGREPCLDKLRDKMKLVLQVSSPTGSSAGKPQGQQPRRKSTTTTGMKRRTAKISAIGPSYIETRSMLELQLGFLTMQYGLLIHWDTVKTGQIVFVCLRKMCHDTFYSKLPDQLPEPTMVLRQQQRRLSSRMVMKTKKEATPPLVVRNHQGDHAIYQRSSGSTEVVLVDGEYRVPQPKVFAPSILTVDIRDVTGLDHKRSQWTLSVTFHGHTEIAHLQYNPETDAFQTTRTSPCKWEMMQPQTTSFDMAGLEIRLFEQRSGLRGSVGNILAHGNRRGSYNCNHAVSNRRYSRRSSNGSIDSLGSNTSSSGMRNSKKTSRLASTMTMPMGGLVSQPSASPTTSWKLAIPFTHDEKAKLSLTLSHQSEYSHWLYKELRARRSEEIANSHSLWQPSLLKRLVSTSADESLMGVEDDFVLDYQFDEEDGYDSEDEFYLSDWLCGFCYIFSLSAPH